MREWFDEYGQLLLAVIAGAAMTVIIGRIFCSPEGAVARFLMEGGSLYF